MAVLETFRVEATALPCRLIDFCLQHFQSLSSRSSIKKAIKRQRVLVDGEVAGEGLWLKEGQTVQLLEAERTTVFPMKLKVVFEDDHLAVVDKPPGVPVSGNRHKTVQNALLFNLDSSSEKDALAMPRPVHRLDYHTSGLLLVAKTASALADLGRQFEQKKIEKRYRALVAGRTLTAGNVDQPVDGLPARSRYRLVKHGRSLHTGWISLLDLFPETGRTHQLRIHMASLGHPVLGDDKYGDVAVRLRGKGLFLCAVELAFRHPVHGIVLRFRIPHPQKFDTFFAREQRRWKNSNERK